MAGLLEAPFRDRLAERRRKLQQFARGGGPQ
jgi:hypothetical protein